MEIKNPGSRFGFPNAPGDVTEDYHKSSSFSRQTQKFDDVESLDYLEIVGQLWISIRVFELTLRNFVHQRLFEVYQNDKWWLNNRLIKSQHVLRYQKAKNIQGLTLSSLTLLFSAAYKETWEKVFFPSLLNPRGINRSQFHKRLEYVRKFRNIIAHHGYLRKSNVIQSLIYMYSIASAIDPKAADWLFKTKKAIEELMKEIPN